MNAVRAFIDTNLLVYLYSGTELDKSQKVLDALSEYDCVVSTQVLNEFCSVCTRKMKISPADTKKAIAEIIAVCRLVVVGERNILHALKSSCSYLLSEDMSDGQVIDASLIIKNIF